MKLSDKIRILRKARGFSQEGLGNTLSRVNENGISRQTISDWENGNCEPKLENIRDLASVLNVSFDALLDETVDLNDPNTLNFVLKNLSEETKKHVNSKFRYRIYLYDVTVKDYISLIIYFVLLFVSVVALCLIPLALKVNETFFIIYVILFSTLCLSLLALLSIPIGRIKKIKAGGSEFAVFGELNNTHLIFNASNRADNTIYIPVEKIESIEVDKNATATHGTVLIHIKGRARPVKLVDIRKPFELIEFYNSLNEIIEYPDEVKIL